MQLVVISTGSRSLDSLLGGGVRTGMVTDIYGESGSGKSQLCFTLCVNCVKNGMDAMFVDTAGTFRPERISEISGAASTLGRISFVRAISTADQISAVHKIPEMDPGLVVIDTLTSLFSAEYSGPARHLAVMNHLRELALSAINLDCAVVVTNMVRNAPITVTDQAGRNVARAVVPSEQREFLGSSVSVHSHVKLKLEIAQAARSISKATLARPPSEEAVELAITSKGISDPN